MSRLKRVLKILSDVIFSRILLTSPFNALSHIRLNQAGPNIIVTLDGNIHLKLDPYTNTEQVNGAINLARFFLISIKKVFFFTKTSNLITHSPNHPNLSNLYAKSTDSLHEAS